MEDILKSINSISGVGGSFICDAKGKVLSAAMPGAVDNAMLSSIGRTITQTIGGLALTLRRKVDDSDLVFSQGRFIVKNLGDSYLCILCARNINVPLLNMTTNLAVKKLAKLLEGYKEKDVQEGKVQKEWKSRAQWLNSELQAIVSSARGQGVILQATGDAAIRLRCPIASKLGIQLEEKILDLVAREKQVAQIIHIVENLGFAAERNFNMLNGQQRLRFVSTEKQLGLEVFLDSLTMYHKLNFADRLHLGDETISIADLLLWQLQFVELDEGVLKSIFAILSDHELGGPGEADKIETKYILDLCSSDWGWFKTVTMNLEKSIVWAEGKTGLPATRFLERARNLWQMIKDAPKSGGWQLRARIGESRRWYEIPE